MFKTSTGWVCFKSEVRHLCGSVDLLQGAAAGCSLGQGLFQPTELLQCFVDDPVMAMRGTECTRNKLLGILFLFWTLLGFRFQSRKVGPSIVWIGIKFTNLVAQSRSTIFTCLKFSRSQSTNKDLMDWTFFAPERASCRSPTSVVLDFWCIQVHQTVQRVFVGCHRGTHRNDRTAHICHVSEETSHPSVVCAADLTSHQVGPYSSLLANSTSLPVPDQNSKHGFSLLPVFPSYTWLFFPFFAWELRSSSEANHGHEWPSSGTNETTQLLAVIPKDPAWQAEVELFAMLIRGLCTSKASALRSFKQTTPERWSTSKALSQKTAAVNSITAEIASRLKAHDTGITLEHMPSVVKFECDSLSRSSQDAQVSCRSIAISRSSPKECSHLFCARPKDVDTTK